MYVPPDHPHACPRSASQGSWKDCSRSLRILVVKICLSLPQYLGFFFFFCPSPEMHVCSSLSSCPSGIPTSVLRREESDVCWRNSSPMETGLRCVRGHGIVVPAWIFNLPISFHTLSFAHVPLRVLWRSGIWTLPARGLPWL